MVPLIGYVDRFSARPGERIAVKVSGQSDRPYRADLVRIIHAGANPAGPGIELEEIVADFAGTYVSRFQPIHLGSYGVVTPADPVTLPNPCTIAVRVQPWLLDGRPQTFLAIEGGLALSIVHEGAAPIEPGEVECLAWWDFSAEIPTDRIVDRGPNGLHSHLRNLPTRAVRGSRGATCSSHARL